MAINQFIRTAPYWDGVVDFEHALADPANPLRMLPAYDSGDHLHPNDAGMKALADAVTWLDDPSIPIDAAATTVGGTVPATLSLTLGAPPTFGTLTPGVARDYTASTTANVTPSAGDAALDRLRSRPPDERHVRAAAAAAWSTLSKSAWSRPGLQRGGDDHVQAAGRRHRRPAHRRLQQESGVHALLHHPMNPERMLEIALEEARAGRAEGGIPIGAALFGADGALLGRGHNRRVQETTRRSTARPTPSARPAGGVRTATRSWSRRWRRAGTAAGSSVSSGSARWSSASRGRSRAASTGCARRGVSDRPRL